MKVLYITFLDFGQGISGSSVRPQQMYNAFINNGEEVILVSGDDFISHDTKKHKESVFKVNKWLESYRPDICYVENTTHPLFLKEDKKLICRLHEMKVPIGYFYRDMYYKFPDLYPPKKGIKNSLTYHYLNYKYNQDEKFISKYVDILYMPSTMFGEYFNHKKKINLPPAGTVLKQEKIDIASRKSLYIGGISSGYGFTDMIEAFYILNKEDNYPLTVICRKEEFRDYNFTEEELLEKYNWLSICHASGTELNHFYSEASLCISPRHNDVYNNLAASVKLYEYLSHGRPFISTPVKTTMELFSSSHAVLFTKDFKIESLVESIKEYYSKPDVAEEMSFNAYNFISNGNSWADRARQVCNDLARI